MVELYILQSLAFVYSKCEQIRIKVLDVRILLVFLLSTNVLFAQEVHFRVNQVGYFPEDAKRAFLMSEKAIRSQASLVLVSNNTVVFHSKPQKIKGPKWSTFKHQYRFDFSQVQLPGEYIIQIGAQRSQPISISENPYTNYHEELITFMQQQRCGYNPYFDEVCHQHDGRLFYGPVPDSTFIDCSGGWHDAGDQLKYLITSSNATARMLKAFELAPGKFADRVNAFGQPQPNRIPDVLDEAKWGLDWILKLHPRKNWLIHQIADDRDHRGFKFPHKDNAEYGWGPNSYRAAYFATGEPQGLGEWKSKATGIANLAGRSAAALALGARIWESLDLDDAFAQKCKSAAMELYQMGKENQGFQQGNSYGAPYRYNEDSWADDMEWGAAELFRLTHSQQYLEDAMHFADMVKDEGWMAQDSMMHYQKYPFMNMGHYALYQVAPPAFQSKIAGWYRSNIENVLARASQNPYGIGVPFLWCSNNLMVNFITQVLLFEQMTGDYQYHDQMLLHRDWLFGYNPWGTSMFTGIPRNGEVPEDVHLACTFLLNDTPPGGLVDGPIFKSIHNTLKGLTLTEPDEFSAFQNAFVVYHDDIGDYSTNEPTMDGTADAILMMALWSKTNQ